MHQTYTHRCPKRLNLFALSLASQADLSLILHSTSTSFSKTNTHHPELNPELYNVFCKIIILFFFRKEVWACQEAKFKAKPPCYSKATTVGKFLMFTSLQTTNNLDIWTLALWHLKAQFNSDFYHRLFRVETHITYINVGFPFHIWHTSLCNSESLTKNLIWSLKKVTWDCQVTQVYFCKIILYCMQG